MNDHVAGSSNAIEADLYSIYDDLGGNPLFDIKLMRNLERLEKDIDMGADIGNSPRIYIQINIKG